MAGFYGHGNEPSGFIKGGEVLNRLSDYYLLKKHSALWSELVNVTKVRLIM